MKVDIDLIGGPEGATHWGAGRNVAVWFKDVRPGISFQFMNDNCRHQGWMIRLGSPDVEMIALDESSDVTFPPIGSVVRIDKSGFEIWDAAEAFIGVDVTIVATFRTGDTDMVAVEHERLGQCCCFRADMVRTPEQIAAEARAKSIDSLCELIVGYYEHPKGSEQYLRLATYLHDHGIREIQS